jgi:DNA-binding beta-propeller fold protein YncE
LTLLGLAIIPLVLAIAVRKVQQVIKQFSNNTFALALKTTAAVGMICVLTGCEFEQPANEANLDSRFFEEAVVFGSRGVGIGEFNKTRSVAVDLQDNFYAVDLTGRVQKFAPDGKFLLLWQMPQTDLGKPKGMDRDHDGNIIVIEPHYQRVNHFTPQGKLVTQWGCRGTNDGCFMLPRAIAQNSRGEFLVSEYQSAERVQRFASNQPPGSGAPKHLQTIGSPGTGDGEFNRAEGLCVDAQDRLYVADSCNHRIQIFAADGKLIRTYGKAGSALGELSYPYDIKVDAQGFQYVCEFGNSRIQIFDANCKPVEIIGGVGTAPGQFNNPWSIALDSKGNLYVADALNHRVQKLVRRAAVSAAALRTSPVTARSSDPATQHFSTQGKQRPRNHTMPAQLRNAAAETAALQ